jgi:hypothetical protein
MNIIPKIFISYSWSTLKHEEWVVRLAERLVVDGVDVVLDKWDLKAGQDKHTFMESMVQSPDISKVLMICDKKYAEKANNKTGGVGTETQIISPEIYNNIAQEKFIPIVAERDENGKEYLPTFLKSRIYFDLTSGSFEPEYDKLLRNIFGRPSYSKPQIGKAPSYLFEDKVSTYKTISIIRSFDTQIEKNPKRINNIAHDFFDEYYESLKLFGIGNSSTGYDETCKLIIDNLHKYDELKDDYVTFIVKLSKDSNEFDIDILINFLEKLNVLKYPLEDRSSYTSSEFDIFRIIIQELFIYTIAIFLKYECYALVSDLLYANYHVHSRWESPKPQNYSLFYSYVSYLDTYYSSTYSKQTASVMADIIVKRLSKNIDIEDFVKGDILLCYVGQINNVEWFPITYIYGKRQQIDLIYKLTSRRYFEKVKSIFDVDTPEQLSQKLNELKSKNRDKYEYSYRGFYARLSPVFEAIDMENLATSR